MWSFIDNMIGLLVCFTIAMYDITAGLKAQQLVMEDLTDPNLKCSADQRMLNW